jgi:hypothetical protein
MATPAQIQANQRNAQRSTGPRTPDGKAAVAQNRTTHGLTGQFTVLACEDRGAFQELLDSYIAEYEPTTPTEQFSGGSSAPTPLKPRSSAPGTIRPTARLPPSSATVKL